MNGVFQGSSDWDTMIDHLSIDDGSKIVDLFAIHRKIRPQNTLQSKSII